MRRLIFSSIVLLLFIPQPATAQVNCQALLNEIISMGPGAANLARAMQIQQIYNTYCLGGQQYRPPQQQVGDHCGNGNTCPVGTRCSWMAGMCYPADKVDCGNYNCEAGMQCANGRRQCLTYEQFVQEEEDRERERQLRAERRREERERIARERREKIQAERDRREAARREAAERAAAQKAAAERAAADRAAAIKAAQDKAAADRAAAQKALADQQAAQKAAAEKAAAERLAAQKAAQEKAEAERRAVAAKLEAERKAALEKQEAERKALADRMAQQKAAQQKAEADRLATQKGAQEKAEADRKAAAAKLEAERKATLEKQEAERKALADKLAAQKAAQQKAEADRLATQKAAQEKAEADRKAAAAKAEADRKAAQEKAEAERRLAAERLAERQRLWPRMGVPSSMPAQAVNKDKVRHDWDTIQLSRVAYNDNLTKGAQVFKGNPDWIVIDKKVDSTTGFLAYAIRNEKENKIVIAVQGSRSLSALVSPRPFDPNRRDALTDWPDDARAIFAGRNPKQYQSAQQFVANMQATYGTRYQYVCTGHSLGGGACVYAAANVSGVRAVAIDPISANSIATNNAYLIDNYIVSRSAPDLPHALTERGHTGWQYSVPVLQQPNAFPSGVSQSTPSTVAPTMGPIGLHSIDRSIEALGRETGLRPYELAQ